MLLMLLRSQSCCAANANMSGQVAVQLPVILVALQKLALDQVLNSLLDVCGDSSR